MAHPTYFVSFQETSTCVTQLFSFTEPRTCTSILASMSERVTAVNDACSPRLTFPYQDSSYCAGSPSSFNMRPVCSYTVAASLGRLCQRMSLTIPAFVRMTTR